MAKQPNKEVTTGKASPIAGKPEWARLAQALKDRRDPATGLGLSQHEVARRAGMGYSTYTPIETLKTVYVPSRAALRKIAVALGWTPESCQLILDGKDPVIATESPRSFEHEVTVNAFSVDVAKLKEQDPEAYAALIGIARKLAAGIG
jgi:transcriptional regulator with XRE-family HTH domain